MTTRASSIRNRQSAIRNAFSLVELLVVIGLIVVVMALALPAFNFISGSKSIDSATNVISAYLGRARAEAIAAGKPSGVLFYIDKATDRRMMVMVQQAPARIVRNPDVAALDQMDVWLDLMADTEPVAMPVGIEVQFINDGTAGATPPGSTNFDKYIGFNNVAFNGPKARTEVRYGNVILFDGAGRLICKTFGFRGAIDFRDTTNTLQARRTRISALLLDEEYNPDDPSTWIPTPQTAAAARDIIPTSPPLIAPLRSALGIVLVESERFNNAPGNVHDTQLDQSATGIYTVSERAEETWLDENATPLLINRYNGTLVKGQ